VRNKIYRLINIMMGYDAVQLPKTKHSNAASVGQLIADLGVGKLLLERLADETFENQ
jgi:hypothetical protein